MVTGRRGQLAMPHRLMPADRRPRDRRTVASGKTASFVVLNANPLDDITNTRRIDDVYLHGLEWTAR